MDTCLINNKSIFDLCRRHKVNRLCVFGSAVKGLMRPDSDIDLVVSFNGVGINDYADNYFDLKFRLEELLKRPVDLLEEQAIRNPYFRKEIEISQQVIYG